MGKNKLYITINDKKYSNHNNILSDIAIKLEDIINTLSKDNIEEIKERITDIIIMTNAIIEENNENFKAIDAEIKNLNRKIYSKNNIIEKVFDEGKFIGTLIIIKKKGKENLAIMMEIHMKENIKMIWEKEEEYIIIKMEINI